MIVRLAVAVFVAMDAVDVPVRMTVHHAVEVRVGVRMRVVGWRLWPFRHAARFGPIWGKAR